MKLVLITLTFIPWLCHYAYYCNIALVEMAKTKVNGTYLKNNFNRIFRLETLLLMSLFMYFTTYHNLTVNIMLFMVINLYLFINIFYDNRYRNKKIIKRFDFFVIIPLLIISILPFIYYLINNHLTLLYKILFGYGFLAYALVLIIYFIKNKIKK